MHAGLVAVMACAIKARRMQAGEFPVAESFCGRSFKGLLTMLVQC